MLKKAVSIVTLLSIGMSLTACGSDTTLVMPTEQSTQQVQANSFLGVYKEIKNAGSIAFKEMDTNGDGSVSPTEYGVNTSDGQKAFTAIDKNHDGKIDSKEMAAGFFGKIGLASRLKKAADGLFKTHDINKDKLLSKEELSQSGLSSAFMTYFSKYDVQKKTLLHKDATGMLSQSEFENLYAFVSVNNLRANETPGTTPTDPATPPADPSAPATDDSGLDTEI